MNLPPPDAVPAGREVTFVHDTEDLCTACGGRGGEAVVLDEADDFRIMRGWAPCPVCGGSGTGEDQRRREGVRCREWEEALG